VCLHIRVYCTEQDSCSIHVKPYTTGMTLCNIKWITSATGVVWRNEKLRTREATFHEQKFAVVALHSARAKITIEKISWLQQRERQRDRLYNLHAMNPSFVNAINSKLSLIFSKLSQFVLAILRESVKQPSLLKAELFWRRRTCISDISEEGVSYPIYPKSRRKHKFDWAGAFIREKSGTAPDFKISPRTSPRAHPKW
jgi:hypothetical protein